MGFSIRKLTYKRRMSYKQRLLNDQALNMMAVSDWTTHEVGKWLRENNFREYMNLFVKEHKIDGLALLSLTEQDLRDPPLEICVLGDIKRLGLAIRRLQLENIKDSSVVGLNLSNLSNNSSYMLEGNKTASPNASFLTASSNANNSSSSYRRNHSRLDSVSTEYSTVSDDEDGTSITSYESKDLKNQHDYTRNPLPSEYSKLCLSCIYMISVFLTTAFVMVVVNDRVPDMAKWPPLPDLILDNLPYIPWAFQLCEVTAMTMMIILIITLFLHKHRFIIIRRLCVLSGTIFLLRCVTMFITSLSVPGKHLHCVPYPNATWSSKVERAFIIWRGAGMSIQGVRTCGDYMFSGHTVVVTLLNFFITEYTPYRFAMLHTATWIGNIFGIFFILAAHEHYSIDVFVAFYITSRLFLYYHSLANNRVLRQADRRRTRVWFPMFSFFESRVNGIVPNEYEWPFPTHRVINDWFVTLFDIKRSKKKKRT